MDLMLDTPPEVQRIYYAMLAEKSFTQRAQLTQELSARARGMSQAGIRAQHPEYTEEDIRREYVRRITTRDEFNVLFPTK